MSRNLVKLFVAFLAGQIFTIFLVFVGRVLYVDSRLWFCIITSVMVDAIIGFVGFFAANEAETARREKTYLEYAEGRTTK